MLVMAEKTDFTGRELKKGSIRMCVLSLLRKERKYGFQLIKELREESDGYFDLKEGTLYPALHRMEKHGFVRSEWITEGSGNPRKYYVITERGIIMLEEMKREWERLRLACEQVMEANR